METRYLHPHGMSCHFLPGHGVLAVLSSCYQRSRCCCTDTSFPLLPKDIGELCRAVRVEIKGKSLTWHFIISCHHQRVATKLLDELGLGCLEKTRQGGRAKVGRQCRDKLSRSLRYAKGKRSLGKKMQALNPFFTACKRHLWAKPSLPLDMLIIPAQSVEGDFCGTPQDQPRWLPGLALGTPRASLHNTLCPAHLVHFTWDGQEGWGVRWTVESAPLRDAFPHIIDMALDLEETDCQVYRQRDNNLGAKVNLKLVKQQMASKRKLIS